MSLTRFADTDDSGLGTDGTVHNNAWLTLIWDAIDGRWSEASTTSTGNQDNVTYSEADVLRCNNATTITLRGLLAPASPVKPGKRLLIVSVGAGTVVLNDQDANSTAANQIITGSGAAITLAAGTGYAWLEYDSVTARWRVVGSSATFVVDNSINDFRLSLTTAVPVTTTDVTGATSIYACQYKGNRITLFNGTNWNVRTSAEFSLALGTLTSGKPYDVFCYDNAGTPTLEVLAWTNDTTRATALAFQDGVLSKSGAITRRYLGTFYTTSTTQTEDSAVKRFLWNYYHRVPRKLLRRESTSAWNYTTNTFRQANAAAANQVEVVVGVAEAMIELIVAVSGRNTNGAIGFGVGIGEDSTSANSANTIGGYAESVAASAIPAFARLETYPAVGYHFYAWLETSSATGTLTWFGTAFSNQASGLMGSIMG